MLRRNGKRNTAFCLGEIVTVEFLLRYKNGEKNFPEVAGFLCGDYVEANRLVPLPKGPVAMSSVLLDEMSMEMRPFAYQ